jgi:hypothetical protein
MDESMDGMEQKAGVAVIITSDEACICTYLWLKSSSYSKMRAHY